MTMYFTVRGNEVFASTGGKPFEDRKPTIIFLHGSGFDHTFWDFCGCFFADRGFAVVAPDAPGHSRSGGQPIQTIEELANWLNDVVNVLGPGNISLIAHSQGCLTALEFASRYAAKVRSLSLIASGLATPVNPALLHAAQDDPEEAIAMMLSWGFGPTGHRHQGAVPANLILEDGRKVLRGNVPEALATDLRACNDYKNGKEAAGKIGAPVQVILGGQDRMAPRNLSQDLIDHLHNPDVHVLEDSGHMVPLEAPNRTRTLLKDFVVAHNPAT